MYIFKLQIADYKLLVVVLSVLRGKVVTIIGAGRIGSAFIQALRECYGEGVKIVATGRRDETIERAKMLGAEATKSNRDAVRAGDVVILSVKPQHFPEVVKQCGRDVWLLDVWRSLLKLLPPEKQQLCDYNMLQWNRLARIPMTVNYKDGKKAWAWIVQPSVRGWLDFKWSLVEPLDPAGLPVAKIKVAIPTLQRHFVEPVDDATPVSVEGQVPSTARKPRRYEWVKRIIERGCSP